MEVISFPVHSLVAEPPTHILVAEPPMHIMWRRSRAATPASNHAGGITGRLICLLWSCHDNNGRCEEFYIALQPAGRNELKPHSGTHS
jgi:hypothetical protein